MMVRPGGRRLYGSTRTRMSFDQPSREAASQQWRKLIDAFAEPADRLAKLMREAEDDVLAFMAFPKEHRTQLHSTNPLERLNKEVKRRTHVVGIFPNDDAIIRLVGAILLEQNDEWAVQRARYMTLETIARLSDDPLISLPAVARDHPGPAGERGDQSRQLHHLA